MGIDPARNVVDARPLRWRVVYARLRGVLDGTIGALFILFGGRLLWRALAR